jgi:long-subunit acyl-CoA synthetase (AMP-forming)
VPLRYKKLGIWHDVTWNQYHQRVKEVCLALISWGLEKGECVSVIDEDNVVKYAQDHKIQYTTYASLTQHAEVQKLIQKEVDKVNKTLANVETVKKFTILSKKLYEEDGEVTPTLKVKRKYINEAFKDLIEAIYKNV